jgi:cytochrome c oxidase subunit 2
MTSPGKGRACSCRLAVEGGGIVTADEAYIRDCILLNKHIPAGYQPVMPHFQDVVNEEQITSLIAYIRSLSAEQQGASR